MKLSIIGAGAMGSAVALGLNDCDSVNKITVANPHAEKLAPMADAGYTTTTDNSEAVRDADLVIIAVKPWILPGVISEIATSIPSGAEVCVIVAGVTCADLAGMFPTPPANLSIAMPNTAMTVGQSMTFIVEALGKATLAKEVFSHLGQVMVIEERLLPGATALASCGIAYAMRYVRAATEGGVELGFRASEAQKIICQTLLGAVTLLDEPGAHPESEIDKVTTPGGLTIRGLNAMESAGFTPAVISGLKASIKK